MTHQVKAQCTESTIGAIVLELLELASSDFSLNGPSHNDLTKATYLVSSLAVGVQNSPILRQAILYSLSTNAFAGLLHRFLRAPAPTMPPGLYHGSLVNCPFSTLKAKSDLSKSLCALLVKTAMYASQDEISLDSSVATNLLDKHINLSETAMFKCDSYDLRSAKFALENVPLSAPIAELSSRGWRESLLLNLSTAAQHQHNSIVNIVGKICQDLEARCDNTEQPLLAARKRSDELEMKLRDSEATLTTLENQARERLLTLQALQTDNHGLVEQTDTAEQRLRALLTSHEDLTYRLDCVKEDALKSAETAREKEEEKSLAHLAMMIGKDEINEKQALKLAEAEARATRLEDELAQKSAASEEILDRLEHSIREVTEELEATKLSVTDKEKEIARLVEHKALVTAAKQESELKVLHVLDKLLRTIH